MSIDLEQIRSANPIEHIVGEKFTLKRQGTRFVGVEHDSLVVTPQTGLYFWNSRGEHGDVFDFAGRHLLGYDNRWNNRDAAMFWEAVRSLAQRAGSILTLRTTSTSHLPGQNVNSYSGCTRRC